MPTTTTHGLTKPGSRSEPADGFGAIGALADSADLQFGKIMDAWTSYTPTWAGTSNPAIGNGTLSGKYLLAGKLVMFRVVITMGSTTTYGTGEWTLTLPYSATTAVNGPAFNGVARDVSASASYLVIGELSGASTLRMRITGGASGVLTSLTATAPFTWANTDTLLVSGVYEAA